jgi:hypothetical protein
MDIALPAALTAFVAVFVPIGVWAKASYGIKGRDLGLASFVTCVIVALVLKATGEFEGSWLLTVLAGLSAGLSANGAYSLTKAVAGK